MYFCNCKRIFFGLLIRHIVLHLPYLKTLEIRKGYFHLNMVYEEWAGSSVSNVLTVQAGGPNFALQSPHKRAHVVVHFCNLSIGEMGDRKMNGTSWLPNLLFTWQAPCPRKRPCLKKKWGWYLKNEKWDWPLASIHNAHMHVNTYTQVIVHKSISTYIHISKTW